MNRDLEKLRAIADYQFGYGAGTALFPDESEVEYSKNTGRPRHVFIGNTLLANYRPNDALFTITISGAKRIIEDVKGFDQYVVVVDDVVTTAGSTLRAIEAAEAGKGIETHAWFIAFAPAENPEVAVAIVLENAGVGGRVAAPRARTILEAALAR